MKSAELKSKQAPLKEQYRASPATALAEGRIVERVSSSVGTGRALVACAGVTLAAVVSEKGREIARVAPALLRLAADPAFTHRDDDHACIVRLTRMAWLSAHQAVGPVTADDCRVIARRSRQG